MDSLGDSCQRMIVELEEQGDVAAQAGKNRYSSGEAQDA